MWKYLFSLIALAALYLAWPQAPSVTVQFAAEYSDVAEQPSNQPERVGYAQQEYLESQQQRLQIDAQKQAGFLQSLLAEAKKLGQGNLQSWLEPMWRQCQYLGVSGCAQWLEDISAQLSAGDAAWLKQALANFASYQEEVQQYTANADKSAAEKLADLKQLREHHLGNQTDAIFGLEHNYADYQLQYAELKQSNASLTVEERLERLQSLQDNTQLGALADDLLGPDAQYQQALGMLDDIPEQERQQWQQQLRERYFGEQAEQVAQYERKQQQQQAQQQSYQQQLQALQQRWQGQLDSAGYQQELQALRQQMFSR